MMRRNHFILAVFAIAGAFGCQAILGIDDTSFNSGDDAGGDGSQNDASAPVDASTGDDLAIGLGLVLTPTLAHLVRGSSVDVDVTISGGHENLSVTVSGLPTGVTASPLNIAAGASNGTLHLAATATATLGDVPNVMVGSPSTASSATLNLFVQDPSGTVDVTFASGEAAFAPGDAGTGATGIAVGIQKNNSAVIAVVPGSGTGWMIVRLDPSGALDSTFNANTAAVLPTSGTISDVVIGSADDIYAAGTSQGQLTVVHLLADGTRDNLFGTNGVSVLDNVDFSSGSTGVGIAVQSDDRPIAIGATKQGPASSGLAVRFDKDGSRDLTFNGGGRFDFSSAQALRGVAVTADDRIAIGGTDSNFMLAAHLLASGAIDTTFSPSGAVDGTQIANGGVDISIRPDAGYVVVGVDNQGIGGCAITQFTLVGDASTKADETYPATINGRCTAVTTQPDGKFLIVGGAGGSFDHSGFILRMVSVTTRDPSFNDGGGVVYAADHSSGGTVPYRFFNDIAVGPDGRIVAVGSQQSAGVLAIRIWP